MPDALRRYVAGMSRVQFAAIECADPVVFGQRDFRLFE